MLTDIYSGKCEFIEKNRMTGALKQRVLILVWPLYLQLIFKERNHVISFCLPFS